MALFRVSNRVIASPGFLGPHSQFWLEELHHPVPGQQGPGQAAGAPEGANPVRHQDRGETAHIWLIFVMTLTTRPFSKTSQDLPRYKVILKFKRMYKYLI